MRCTDVKAMMLSLAAIAILVPGASAQDTKPAKSDRPPATRWALGGGFVGATASPDVGDDIHGEGAFVAVQGVFPSGMLFQAAISGAEDNESGPLDSNLTRLGLTVGYMFRRHTVVRPFVHAGLSSIHVNQDLGALEVIDDDSQAFTLGVGLVVGPRHHAFYFDAVSDAGHEVDTVVESSAGFDLGEAHLGYMYRF